MIVRINCDWKFNDVLRNLKMLKRDYLEVLMSFSYTRERNNYIKHIKNQIYSLKFDVNKIDKIWEYMNDDLTPLEIFIFLHFDE